MKKEKRLFRGGPIVLMAYADGYCMVRRPGCIPFAIKKREWDNLLEIYTVTKGKITAND